MSLLEVRCKELTWLNDTLNGWWSFDHISKLVALLIR